MDRLIDHVLQKTCDAILHSIGNMDSMHESCYHASNTCDVVEVFNVKGPLLVDGLSEEESPLFLRFRLVP